MNLVTAQKMKEIDKRAIYEYGIPSIVLMENAGRRVSEIAIKMLEHAGNNRVSIFCGKGNNGGDGFVATRHLINKEIEVTTFLIGRAEELSADARTNYRILIAMNAEVNKIQTDNDWKQIKEKAVDTDLTIDALLGIGLNGEIRGLYKSVIEFLNQAPNPILSVDIPSGLNADSGKPCGVAIKAKKTVTLGLAKTGLVTGQGVNYAGEVVVADIGIPRKLLREET